MSKDAEKFLAAALGLSEHERAEIAARLLESLDESEQGDIEEAWASEIERRCAVLDSDEVGDSSWEEFRARVEGDIFGR